jgi:RNA polymerase sigma factor (sigma-70 family)
MATAPLRTDAELVQRLHRRDRTAWDELYRTYQDRLYRFAYRLSGNAHDAADLVQETFVRALPRLDRLPPERADVAAYLFATTKNLFLKQVARGKRTRPVDEVPEPDEPGAIEDDPERANLLRRQQEEVRLANGRLAPRQRLVLALRELEDKSYAEIGELVGLNENAVAQLISRARQSLREELRLVQVDRSKLPDACQGYLPFLSEYLDGQLKGPKRDETLAHLEGCEHCQKALADMEEAKRRYRALIPPLAAIVALRQKVDDALGATGYWEKPADSRLARLRASRRVGLVLGVSGLALLGGLGGGLAVALGGESSEVALTAPATIEPGAPPSSPSDASSVLTYPATGGPATTLDTSPAGTGTETATTDSETEQPPATTDGETEPPATTAEPPATTGETEPPATTTEPPATTDGGTTTEHDTTAPSTSIGGGPDDPTTSAKATFKFSASESASFGCSLDGGAWKSCSSPSAYSGLELGHHTFRVRATDNAGNTGQPASWGWTIVEPPDTTAPSVTIISGPPDPTTSTNATLRFDASEPATFECSLDGGGFAGCGSPAQYSGLRLGRHTFRVRATDQAGNTGTAASYAWTIEAPALPDLVVSSLSARGVVITNTGQGAAGAFVVRVVGVGSFSFGGLAPGASVSAAWDCVPGTLTAVVDAGGQVAESNERNNSASITASCRS